MKTKIYVDWENRAVYTEREFNTNREIYANDFGDDEFEGWLNWNYTLLELYNIGMNQSMFLVNQAWDVYLENEMQDYDERFECITIGEDEKE